MSVSTHDGDLAVHMPIVARELLGDPNAALSSQSEWRYGSQGSLAIDIGKGTAYSHEDREGGGVLWLIKRIKGLEGREAFEFLRDIGCDTGSAANGYAGGASSPKAKIVATYDYVDEAGELLFQVARYEPKTFRQRRPDGAGGWSWSVKGVRQVPYRLPELVEAIAEDRVVLIVEGEKDVDNLARWGVPATCNARGAGKWTTELGPHLAGADVVLVPDNDDAGRSHVDQVATLLRETAKSIRVLELPGLPPKGDISDWIAAGGTPDLLYRLVEQDARPWSEEPFRSRFGLVMWADQDAPGEEYDYLVEDLIPQREAVLIQGESQCGKSFLTLHMAVCAARGVPFFDRAIGERFGVVYCAYEAGKGFRNRLRAYRQHHGLALEDLPLGILTKPIDLWSNEVNIQTLCDEILGVVTSRFNGVPLGAVVIDTHNAATPGASEVDSKEVSQIRERYHAIMRRTGAGVWIVGHKNAQGGTRGNLQLYNNIETVIDISRRTLVVGRDTQEMTDRQGRPVRQIWVRKQREGKDGARWDFVLDSVEIGKNKFGRPRTSCIVTKPDREEPAESKRKTDPNALRLSPQQNNALRALKEALAEFGEAPIAALKLPRSIATVVRVKHWYDVYRRTAAEDSPEAVRQAMKRANDAFLDKRVIGRVNPFVWLTGRPVAGVVSGPSPIEEAAPPERELGPDWDRIDQWEDDLK